MLFMESQTTGGWSRTPIGTDTGAHTGIGAGASVLFSMFSFEIRIMPHFDEVILGYK